MHCFKILPLILFSFLITNGASFTTATDSTTPTTPGLTYLYTAYVDCSAAITVGPGPKGTRLVIPIVGGNFTGPRLSGKILDLGADWGTVDSNGTFSPDTRYQLQTNDGANIFIRTSGPSQSDGTIYLRVILETGSANYYWVNNIVAIAKLYNVGNATENGDFTLKIDTWQLT